MATKKKSKIVSATLKEAIEKIIDAEARIKKALETCDKTSQEMNCRYGLENIKLYLGKVNDKATPEMDYPSIISQAEAYADLAEEGIEVAEEEKDNGIKAKNPTR